MNCKHGLNQRGGNCAATVGQLAHRVSEVGKDERLLGRWVWVEFKGKMGTTTRVYVAYRPGRQPAKTSKKTTVYHQHAQYIRSHKLDYDPRSLFDKDLLSELTNAMKNSNIILMLDANEDIEKGSFNDLILSIGMKNTLYERVQQPMPATHHRGSRPISAIYHTPGLVVTRAGILPTGIGIHGDHRNIYADFDERSFLGDPMFIVADNSMKKLQLRDSRICKRYVQSLKKHLLANNWLVKAKKTMEIAAYPPSPEVIRGMEQLDEQLGRGIAHAVHHCRTIKMGKIPYSESFHRLQKHQRLWLLVYKKKIGQKVSASLINRLSKFCGYVSPLSYTMKEVLFKKHQAEKEYSELVPHASNERKRFLEELAAANAQEMQIEKSKMVKRIMKEESIREQNVSMRSCFPKAKGPSVKVDKVEVNRNGEWVEISKPTKLVQALQKENEQKYNCTGHSPLMNPHIHKKLGNFAETRYARQMQEGLKDPPETLPYWTKVMLNKTRFERNIPRIKVALTEEEVRQTWRVTKEKKASAPSGRYNATYKAMAADKTLLKYLTMSMNLPLLTGHAYQRWHTFLDIMAFKKENCIQIDSLRSIVLSEADWNATGRILITKKMMQQAENLELLPNEHLGGRKGRKSIEGAISKQLYIDNTRIMRIPTIILSTDAANCYDRMVHKYISLMCVKWGIEPQVMSALLSPLQSARHHTRTAYGDSTSFFQGKNLQGAGQGNTGAAPYWTCISTSMIEVMKEEGMTSRLRAPISNRDILLALIAFVDDTEIFLTDPDNNIDNLIRKAQKALDTWKHVLNATGGAMRSKKCAWLLLAYAMQYKETIFETSTIHTSTLKIQDDDGITRPIKRYEYDDSREYLGVLQSANNDVKDQLKIMESAVLEWNSLIQKSKLSPTLNLNALFNRIHKQLEYPLPATVLTKKQLSRISDKLYKVSLPKCGIIRTFPKRFRTLPTYYYGLNLPNLYLSMQIGKLKEVVRHTGSSSILGQQLQISFEIAQLESGQESFILNANYKRYSQLVSCSWVKHVWRFVHDMSLHFKGWKQGFGKQRQHDTTIMDTLIDFGYTGDVLEVLNQSRQFLQVIYVSDIVTGNGKRLVETMLNGYKDPSRKSKFTWKSIKKPTLRSWCIWRDSLKKALCVSVTGVYLRQPLGKWINTEYQDWYWYKHSHSNTIYRFLSPNDNVQEFRPKPTMNRTRSEMQMYEFHGIVRKHVVPPQLIRATISSKTKNNAIIRYEGAMGNLETRSDIPRSYFQFPSWSFLRYHNLQIANETILTKMANVGLRIVADGSYQDHHSSFAVILESLDKEHKLIATGIVPANTNRSAHSTDPYRSEIFGLYVGLKIWKEYEQAYDIQSKIVLSCDNDRALEVSGLFSRWDTNMQHFDIVRSIFKVRSQLKSNLTIERVMGHADQKVKHRGATRVELLNQSCDTLAKTVRAKFPPIGPYHLEDEDLSIWHNGEKIYSDFTHKLRHIFHYIEAKPILNHQFNWRENQFDLVDWKASRKAMTMFHKSKQVWISKYITGFLPIGKNMQRRAEWISCHCPRCGEPIETSKHIPLCREKKSMDIYSDSIDNLNTWMKKMDTPPQLREEILLNIALWHDNHPYLDRDNSPLSSQFRIGNWNNFMEGRIHLDITELVHHHYVSIGSRKNGRQWTSLLIHKLWSLFYFSQWDIRNKYVHNQTDATKISRQREDLQVRIAREYNSVKKSSLLVKDQHLMDETVEGLMKMSNDAMTAWLLEFKLAKRDRDEMYQVHNEDHPTLLRRWLVPKRKREHLPNNTMRKCKLQKKDHRQWNTNGTKTTLLVGSWKPP